MRYRYILKVLTERMLRTLTGIRRSPSVHAVQSYVSLGIYSEFTEYTLGRQARTKKVTDVVGAK